MEDRGKTIMCSVLFLDIVEYSKKSVSGQISLKERFNAYLSVAIRDVPIDDRIILDTGDGAAISFLGDVEDALQVALSMRESLREGMHMEPPLLVRMGINLGPVRLVRDINGQPNIVGDGINVAQRVMGFSDPGQILVSRPYYDAVSRLSSEYAGMFHYQGSRTDKHVREHEIYAIGYPGEFTSTMTLTPGASASQGELTALSKHLGKSWQAAAATFQKASPLKRVVYAGVLIVPLVAVIGGVVALVVMLARPGVPPAPPAPVVDQSLAAASQVAMASQVAVVVPVSAVAVPVSAVAAIAPASVVAPAIPASAVAAVVPQTAKKPGEHDEATETPEQEAREYLEGKEEYAELKKAQTKAKGKPGKEKKGAKKPSTTESKREAEASNSKGTLTVVCAAGTNVFVDGHPNGKLGKAPMVIRVEPGKHLIMLIHPTKSQVHSENVDLAAGKSVKVSPGDFCR